MSLETKQKKFYGTRRAIMARVSTDGTAPVKGLLIWRRLDCGHRTLEPRGGKAKDASFALCRLCADAEAAERRT